MKRELLFICVVIFFSFSGQSCNTLPICPAYAEITESEELKEYGQVKTCQDEFFQITVDNSFSRN